MNLIFHDLLGYLMEVYIDDIVIKLADLWTALKRTRSYNLKMKPLKCTIGVSAVRFLGFIVHESAQTHMQT
jgi:uncharacterized membrane protein YqhA